MLSDSLSVGSFPSTLSSISEDSENYFVVRFSFLEELNSHLLSFMAKFSDF